MTCPECGKPANRYFFVSDYAVIHEGSNTSECEETE